MPVTRIFDAVMEFDLPNTVAWVQAEIDDGTDVSVILNDGLIAPLDAVGRGFSEGSLFLPEMLQAAKCVQAGLNVLRPLLVASVTKPKGTIAIGTVKGDMHDIGKNLVIMMLEGAGFRVIDLGVNVPPEKFVEAVKDNHVDIVGLSALLTTTLQAMETTVALIKKHCPNTFVIVGGAPVTQALADRIGADGFGEDGPGTVSVARLLTSKTKTK